RRSATWSSVSSRTRTAPRAGGTPEPSSRWIRKVPMRPRWTCRIRSWANSTKSSLPQARAPVTSCPSSSAAPSANRPCGLVTDGARPANAAVRSRASAWSVWPSGTSAGVAQPGGHAVDGDEQGPLQRGAVLGRLLGVLAQPPQQLDLEVGDRVEVLVAHRQGPFELRLVVEQPFLAGEPADLLDGEVELGPDVVE